MQPVLYAAYQLASWTFAKLAQGLERAVAETEAAPAVAADMVVVADIQVAAPTAVDTVAAASTAAEVAEKNLPADPMKVAAVVEVLVAVAGPAADHCYLDT